MLEALGDFVALNWEAFVTAVSQLLDDATLIELDDTDRLFPIVYWAHTPRVEFSFKGCFLLFDDFMWQFYLFVVGTVYFIPNETEHIFAGASHVTINSFDGVLALDPLPVAGMN